MRLEVLGCSGSAAPGHRPSSYRVGRTVAIDAGCVATALELHEQCELTDLLLTHAHVDHIASLPWLIDNRMAMETPPLRIHALPATLDALRDHIFNGVLWPTFEQLHMARPTVELFPLNPEQSFTVEDGALQVDCVALSHTLPTLGFQLTAGGRAMFLAGDTGEVGPVRELLQGGRLEHLLLEASWPSRMRELAFVTGHLTPRMLEDLPFGDCRLAVTHLKPAHHHELRAELAQMLPAAEIAGDGMVREWGGEPA